MRPVAVQGGKRLLRAGFMLVKIPLRLRIAAAVAQRVQGLDAIRQQRQVHRAIIKPADVALRQPCRIRVNFTLTVPPVRKISG